MPKTAMTDSIAQKNGLSAPGMFPNTRASMNAVTGKSTAKPTLSRMTSVSELAASQLPNVAVLLDSQDGKRKQINVTRNGAK